MEFLYIACTRLMAIDNIQETLVGAQSVKYTLIGIHLWPHQIVDGDEYT